MCENHMNFSALCQDRTEFDEFECSTGSIVYGGPYLKSFHEYSFQSVLREVQHI